MHWLSKKSTKIIMIMPAVILFTVFYLARDYEKKSVNNNLL